MIFAAAIGTRAWADGPASIYEVRIGKFELYNGTSWITVFEGTSSVIDIASVNSGQMAGQFMSGMSVPDGTYTQSRVTPSQTFKIKGNDGSNRYTTGVDGTGCTYSNAASNEASCEFTVSQAITPDTTTFSTPIVMSGGVPSHKVRVSFDVSQAITYNALADRLFPAQPTVTVTLIAVR
jgi:hypothetical protein